MLRSLYISTTEHATDRKVNQDTSLHKYFKNTGLHIDSMKNLYSILHRYVYPAIYANQSNSDMPTGMSEVVQQLQQDLSTKNMFFSKDSIETFKVIGEGANIIWSVYDNGINGYSGTSLFQPDLGPTRVAILMRWLDFRGLD